MAKPKIYYGMCIEGKTRVMFATVTGQMADGTFVYTECDGCGNLINMDVQYTRNLKYGTQTFSRV